MWVWQFLYMVLVLGLASSDPRAQMLGDDEGHGLCPSGQLPVSNPVVERIPLGDLRLTVSPVVTLPDVVVQGNPRHARLMTLIGDGAGRRFVVDFNGIIYQLHVENRVSVYLDVRHHPDFELHNREAQTGLRAIAFHPEFHQPGAPGEGKVYTAMAVAVDGEADFPLPDRDPVTETLTRGARDHQTVIHEWTALTSDALDPDSARELLRIDQYRSDHNVGVIGFNPNAIPNSPGELGSAPQPIALSANPDFGLLYIALGNGGSAVPSGFTAADPYLTGQDLASPLAAMLRIDPLGSNSPNGQYGIPPHNPFVSHQNPSILGEIWAYGLRNPDSWSFDTGGEGKLLLGDIGQRAVEEINLIEAGRNYGWANRDGHFAGNRCEVGQPEFDEAIIWPLPDTDAGYTYPVISIDRDEDSSGPSQLGGQLAIIGGYVYRGSQLPELRGQYLFAILASGRLFTAPETTLRQGEETTPEEVTLIDARTRQEMSFLELMGNNPLTKRPYARADLRFGQDDAGEIYLLSKNDGTVRLITAATRGPSEALAVTTRK